MILGLHLVGWLRVVLAFDFSHRVYDRVEFGVVLVGRHFCRNDV